MHFLTTEDDYTNVSGEKDVYNMARVLALYKSY